MIAAAEYIYDLVLKPAIDLKEGVGTPSSQAEGALHFINAANFTGDVYYYLLNIIDNKDSENRRNEFNKRGLLSFEDVIEGFEKEFVGELNMVSSLGSMKIGNFYSKYDIAIHSMNYSTYSGVTNEYILSPAMNGTKDKNDIIIRGEIDNSSSAYPNRWINEGEKLIYYLTKGKDEVKTNIKSGLNKDIIENNRIMHFFENTASLELSKFIYKGVVVCDVLVGTEEDRSVVLELVNPQVSNEMDIDIFKDESVGEIKLQPFVFKKGNYNLNFRDGEYRASSSKNIGVKSEKVLSLYFKKKGYIVTHVNRAGYDLIVKDNNSVMYIECKTFNSGYVYLSYNQLMGLLKKKIKLGLVRHIGESKVIVYTQLDSSFKNTDFRSLITKIINKYEELSEFAEELQDTDVVFDSFDCKVRISKQIIESCFSSEIFQVF